MDPKKSTPEKKKNQSKPFVVRIEGQAPVVVEYRVYAEDEDEAFEIIDKFPFKGQLLGPPKPDITRLQKKKVAIKNLFTSMINWTRTF